MPRYLSPRWLAGHLLVLVIAAACLWLGRWQWDRAHEAGGGPQNFGYALQWPLFAVVGVLAWIRIIRIERDRVKGARGGEQPPAREEPAWHHNPAFADEDDAELAAWNRRLAELHAGDERAGDERAGDKREVVE